MMDSLEVIEDRLRQLEETLSHVSPADAGDLLRDLEDAECKHLELTQARRRESARNIDEATCRDLIPDLMAEAGAKATDAWQKVRALVTRWSDAPTTTDEDAIIRRILEALKETGEAYRNAGVQALCGPLGEIYVMLELCIRRA